jgi:hypothetical protein
MNLSEMLRFRRGECDGWTAATVGTTVDATGDAT